MSRIGTVVRGMLIVGVGALCYTCARAVLHEAISGQQAIDRARAEQQAREAFARPVAVAAPVETLPEVAIPKRPRVLKPRRPPHVGELAIVAPSGARARERYGVLFANDNQLAMTVRAVERGDEETVAGVALVAHTVARGTVVVCTGVSRVPDALHVRILGGDREGELGVVADEDLAAIAPAETAPAARGAL